MSMADSMRGLVKQGAAWLRPTVVRPIVPPAPVSVIDDIGNLVRMAGYPGEIDRQSATWLAVSAWAAKELLATLAKLESADDDKSQALRSRAKALRDMLDMDAQQRKPVKFESVEPYIP